MRRSRTLGIVLATALAFPLQAAGTAALSWDADDEPVQAEQESWESADSEDSSASEDSDWVPEDPEVEPIAGPWTFEEHAHGWTIDGGLVLPDVPPTPMQWARQGPGLESDNAMAVTPYGDNVITELVSPVLPGEAGPIAVEWWERWEFEPDVSDDRLDVLWEAPDGSRTSLVHPTENGDVPVRSRFLPYSSAWPDWNRRIVSIDPGGQDLRLVFRVTSDAGCSGVTPCPHRPDDRYLGVWIDDVVVWTEGQVGDLGQDGTVSDDRTRGDRVWEEPADGWVPMEKSEFVHGARALERRFPNLVDFTTVRAELDDDHAMSVGADTRPSWHPGDTRDGRDFHVLVLTDESIPATRKEHLVLSVAHSGEYCGYEGTTRWLEDLAIAFRDEPSSMVRAGSRGGVPVELSVRELLQRVRIVLVEIGPDGWMQSQQNGAGFNTNRIAHQDGWVVPDDDAINGFGYSTLTQPAGAAITTWLLSIREDVQGGRPIAAALDMHGPVPVGNVLAQPQGADVGEPARTTELAARMTERTLEVLLGSEYGALREAYLAAMGEAAETQHAVLDHVHDHGDVELNKVAFLPAGWNSHTTPWEGIDYDIPSGWAAFFASDSGLGADAFTHELPCETQTLNQPRPSPERMQLYVDNMRAFLDVMAVHAWERGHSTVDRFDPVTAVGYVPNPSRVTSSAVSSVASVGYPGTPFHSGFTQRPYDVANTDWFAEAATLSAQPIRATPRSEFDRFGTIVVADHLDADADALRQFAEEGGNVVLTDRALALAADLLGVDLFTGLDHGYVGYAEVDDDHPWAQDHLPLWAQTYNPMPLGHPLLLERDQYWLGTSCVADVCATDAGPETYTQNSAPLWTVDRAAWEAVGGTTIGTVDPPETRKSTHDGTETNRTILGTIPVGEGRLVIFGGILPQPSPDDFHPFGLAAYALTPMGHDLLLDAITWDRVVQ